MWDHTHEMIVGEVFKLKFSTCYMLMSTTDAAAWLPNVAKDLHHISFPSTAAEIGIHLHRQHLACVQNGSGHTRYQIDK